MDKTDSFMEITKPLLVKEVKNLKLKKLLEILTNASIMLPFQKVLKYLRLIPVYKKDEPYDKYNY